jgi:hypothetical protein
MVFGVPTPNAAGLQILARYKGEIAMGADAKTVRVRGTGRVTYTDLGVRDTPFDPWLLVERFVAR